MMESCILITGDYPYDTGEPFLESEIDIMSKHYSNIYIFSLNGKKNDNKKRPLPKNVIDYPINCIITKFKYPYYILRGLFCFDKRLRIDFKGVKRIFSCLYERGRANYIYKRVSKIIKKEKIIKNDCIIYSYWLLDHAICAYRIKNQLSKEGIKCYAISRAHGYDVYWERSKSNYLPFQRTTIECLDAVYCCSNNGKKYLINKYPDLKEKIHVSRLGTVDYGITSKPEKLTFVTCCSLKKLKRISLFAEAFSKFAKNYDSFWYCIGDGEEYEQIKQLIVSNNITDKVAFMGRMKNIEVIDFYKNHKISFFCNVSTTEGVPVSIMEAMSFSIPAIATDVGGTSEIVNSNNGILIDPDLNSEILLSILTQVASMPRDDYNKMRENCRNDWKEKSSSFSNYTKWHMNLINNLKKGE